MTDVVKKSAAEIVKLAKQLAKKNSSLKMPTTAAGLAYRVEKENWDYEEVPTQGGKNGLKKIYTLPVYLIEELKKNNLISQSEIISSPKQPTPAKLHRPYLKTGKHAAGEPVASFMQPMVADYDDWAEQQNTDSIVPVRYHTNAARATATRCWKRSIPKPCGSAVRSSTCWACRPPAASAPASKVTVCIPR